MMAALGSLFGGGLLKTGMGLLGGLLGGSFGGGKKSGGRGLIGNLINAFTGGDDNEEPRREAVDRGYRQGQDYFDRGRDYFRQRRPQWEGGQRFNQYMGRIGRVYNPEDQIGGGGYMVPPGMGLGEGYRQGLLNGYGQFLRREEDMQDTGYPMSSRY